jgi:hypothetical protein
MVTLLDAAELLDTVPGPTGAAAAAAAAAAVSDIASAKVGLISSNDTISFTVVVTCRVAMIRE